MKGHAILLGSILLGLMSTLSYAQAPVPFINLPLVPDATAPGGSQFTLTQERPIFHDYAFTGGRDGANPGAGVIPWTSPLDKKNFVYGTAVYSGGHGKGTFFRVEPTDGAFVPMHEFIGGVKDGCNPYGPLGQDAKTFFGTTWACGAHSSGTVWKYYKETRAYKLLYSFCSLAGCTDGRGPYAGLIELLIDGDDLLFGTATSGGDRSCNYPSGCGVVFDVNLGGVEIPLYAFKGGTDGMTPFAGVISDGAHNLYGTTVAGGSGACTGGCGTVFELRKHGKGWVEKVLHRFAGGTADGANVWGGLWLDAEGNLYGTSVAGGSGACTGGCGTVFELTKHGAVWWRPFCTVSVEHPTVNFPSRA